MAIEVLDLVRELSVTKIHGELVEAAKVFMIRLPADTSLVTAMETTGVPQPGDALDEGEKSNSLKAEDITATVESPVSANDATDMFVRIDVTYRLQRSDDTSYSLEGGSSLASIETAINPLDGTRVTIPYKPTGSSVDGVQHPAKMTIEVPQATMSFEKLVETDEPDAYVDLWIGKTNSATWRGRTQRQWRISSVNYSPHDMSQDPRVYKFSFEIEGSSDRIGGWVTTLAYEDPQKNDIPTDVTRPSGIGLDNAGNGMVTYEIHKSADFAFLAPATVA